MSKSTHKNPTKTAPVKPVSSSAKQDVPVAGTKGANLTEASARKERVALGGDALGKSLFWLAFVFLFAGLLGYYWMPPSYPKYYREISMFGGLTFAALCYLFSDAGKNTIELSKGSWQELKKIVWPTREEAMRMTIVVFVFSAVVSLYLFAVDKIIEKIIFDWIL